MMARSEGGSISTEHMYDIFLRRIESGRIYSDDQVQVEKLAERWGLPLQPLEDAVSRGLESALEIGIQKTVYRRV